MKFKRTGMLTKILLLILLVAAITTFLNLHTQVKALQEQETALEEQVARQRQENDALSAAIQDSDDPSRIEDVAREKLGLVKPGEIVFYDGGN